VLFAAVERADDVCAGVEARVGDAGAEVGKGAAVGSGDDEVGVGDARGDGGEGVGEDVQAFLVVQATHEQDEGGGGEAGVGGAERPGGREGLDLVEEDAVGHDDV